MIQNCKLNILCKPINLSIYPRVLFDKENVQWENNTIEPRHKYLTHHLYHLGPHILKQFPKYIELVCYFYSQCWNK